MFYQKYSNFLFKFRWPVIFDPVDVRKSYVPQKKALNNGKKAVLILETFLSCKSFGNGSIFFNSMALATPRMMPHPVNFLAMYE